MRRILTWMVVLFGMMASLQAKLIRVFVLTGQSNSLGTTKGDGGEGLGKDPADDRVEFFWNNCADPKRSLGDSGGKWVGLREQQGGFYAGNAMHWGPEVGFGRSLVKAGVEDFAIIKVSRGGGGSEHWMKSESGHMYRRVVETVRQATDLITERGDTFEVVGMLYLQGESDTEEGAKVADRRLLELAENLRGDLPKAKKMEVLVGGIGPKGGRFDVVRRQQEKLPQEDGRMHYFSNVDLQSYIYDGLHFSREARLEVGARYARAAIAAKLVMPRYGKLVVIGDSITQGGNGDHASYRYFLFKRLAEVGVPMDEKVGYRFVGSVMGPYNHSKVTTPDVAGQVFENVHEGHFGWRVSWSNGRVALPVERRGQNRGEGCLRNWVLGEKFYVTSRGRVAYPDSVVKDSGSKGVSYVPDTAVILMGINDLSDQGVTAEMVVKDLGVMVDELRLANPRVRIFLAQVLHTNQGEVREKQVDELNGLLPKMIAEKNVASVSSPVWLIDTSGFDAVLQTYDRVHPNVIGEEVVGNLVADGMGL